jgi:prephenate dehydrogenase
LAPEDLVEIATVITDQPGVLAEITTLLGKEGINLYNLEIVHPGETKNGVLVMVVERKELNRAQSLLSDKGYALDAKEEL